MIGVDGVVHPLDHAGEHVPGLDPVLVGVDADDELVVLLGGVENPQTRVAGGGEDHVRPLADLGHRQLLALARVVPRRLGDADVVLDDPDLRVDGARSLLIAGGEPVDEGDVHAADEAEDAGLGLAAGDHAHQVAPLVLLEDQRGHVGQATHAVDDGEVDLRVVLRHRLDDGRLGEADADDEVVAHLGEGAGGGLQGGRIARLGVAQDDGELLRRPRHPAEGRGVERAVVLAAAVEDDPHPDLAGVAGGALQVVASRAGERQGQEEAEG